MLSPTLYGVSAFDADYDQVFEYIWSGPPVGAAKLTIRDNVTNEIVYEVQNNGGTTITLPASSILNDYTYNATVVLLDRINPQSPWEEVSERSNIIIFQCFSKPVFVFVDDNDVEITQSMTITSAQHVFKIKYQQTGGDFLAQLKFTLYNVNNIIVQDKNTHYYSTDPSGGETFRVAETFTSFIDGVIYKIRAVGRTASGKSLDTGYILVYVDYSEEETFLKLQATNNYSSANISLKSNLISIEGEVESGDPSFINHAQLDVRDDRLTFNEGFEVSGNWVMAAAINHIPLNQELLSFITTDGRKGTIYYRELAENGESKGTYKSYVGYFELQIEVGDLIPVENGFNTGHAIYYSNHISPILFDGDQYTLWIKKSDDYYQIVCYRSGDGPIAPVLMYDGTAQALIIPNTLTVGTYAYRLNDNLGPFDEEVPTAVNAGVYTVWYRIYNGNEFILEDKLITTINKAPNSIATYPKAKISKYNGTSQFLIYPGAASYGTMYYKIGDGEYSQTVPSAIDIGEYIITYKTDGGQNHEDIPEQIIRAKIEPGSAGQKPATSVNFDYTGKTITNGFVSNDGLIMTGFDHGITAGTYIATYTPKPGYYWDDGQSGSVTVTLTINKISAGYKPSETVVDEYYTGEVINNHYEKPEGVNKQGNSEGSAIGVYVARYTPDENHYWANDRSSTTVTVTLNIIGFFAGNKPQNVTTTYNGKEQTNGYAGHAGVYLDRGDSKGTNANTYTAYYKLNPGYYWSDNTTDEVAVKLTINKAANPMTVTASQSVTTYYSLVSQNKTFVGPSNYKGTVSYSVKSGNTDITVKDTTMTLKKSASIATRTIVVTAKDTGDNNYNAGEKDITITWNNKSQMNDIKSVEVNFNSCLVREQYGGPDYGKTKAILNEHGSLAFDGNKVTLRANSSGSKATCIYIYANVYIIHNDNSKSPVHYAYAEDSDNHVKLSVTASNFDYWSIQYYPPFVWYTGDTYDDQCVQFYRSSSSGSETAVLNNYSSTSSLVGFRQMNYYSSSNAYVYNSLTFNNAVINGSNVTVSVTNSIP